MPQKRTHKQNTLVVANWKMHPTTSDAAHRLFIATKETASRLRATDVVICPPLIYLTDLMDLYHGRKLAFGAQDAHWEREGSYTGDVSAAMLGNLGVDYVILGHSERRRPAGRPEAAGETSADVARKAKAAIAARLTPIICVGEDTRDEAGEYIRALRSEVRESLAGLSDREVRKCILAYEPRWAIGQSADNALDADALHGTALLLKKFVAEHCGTAVGRSMRILYGGSVEAANAASLVCVDAIAGVLVGHASVHAREFPKLLEAVEHA